MPETINDRVSYDLTDRVARIALANPAAYNSLDQQMATAFRLAAERAAADVRRGDARVVVLTATGKAFSVGGDLAEFGSSTDRGAQVKATADDLHGGLNALRGIAVPVVSVINGTAAGGGLGLALAGDIVIAAAGAKLVFAYTASGLTPDCGTTWVASQRLSPARAMDLALTNRVLTGAEAAEWGLVSRSVPAEDLAAAVDDLVSSLVSGASAALADTKRLLLDAPGRTQREHMEEEAVSIARNIAGPDGVEGVDAFLAKRKPAFT